MSIAPPLESGQYFISSVSFATGKPVSRFIGEGRHPEDAVVVLPLHSSPSLWHIIKLANDTYILHLNGRNARVVDGYIRLTEERLPPFEWKILRGAPSPSPIGHDNFGIFVPNKQPQESWFIGNTGGDQAVPVPVKIGNVASSIHIFPPLT